MRDFNYSEIKNRKWDSEILGLIAAIYKEAGKQEMYLKQRPEELEKLIEIAKIQSTEASNAIEGMAGRTKNVQNYISATYPDGHVETLFIPLAPYETPEALDRICEEYNRVVGDLEVEPLIAVAVFIHDFLCIHPFNDGNGRMSRLLTTLLLYRNGFYVGKYISLEAKIAKNKDLYYGALGQAQGRIRVTTE